MLPAPGWRSSTLARVSQDPWSKEPPKTEQQQYPEYGAPGLGVPDYGGYGTPGHGAPEYGAAPGYGAPGYGAAPGYPPPAYPPQPYGGAPYGGGYVPPTNTLAIVSLIMAFVFAPVGIVLGIMARKQIRQTGESGDGLALAGLIIGIAFTAIFVVIIVIYIVLFAALAGAAGAFSP